jgi:hypothetical protein
MKLIINEWTLLISNGLVSEAKYQDIIKKLKKGDKLEYTDKGGEILNFEVVFNDNGQLYIKNLDSGVYKNNYFFVTVADLTDNNLSFKTINYLKNLPDDLKDEKDDSKKLSAILKTFPIDKWKKSTFKNLDKILMGGEVIDIVKPDAEDEKFKNYISVKDLGGIYDELKALKPGMTYKFTLSNGGEIDLNLIDNKNNSLFFEYNKLSGPAKSYNELINAELILDLSKQNVQQKVSSLTDEENVDSIYTIKFNKLKGGEDKKGNRAYDVVTVKNIKDIDPVGSFNDEDEKDKDTDKAEDIKDISDEEIDDMKVEDITSLVLDNPLFKSAFLSKPNFWKQLVGGKPKGILAAKDILKKFNDPEELNTDKKEKNLVVDFFKNNEEYFLQLTDKSFTRGELTLDISKKYKVKAKKRTNVKGGLTVFLYGDGFIFKINSLLGETKNEFKTTLIINYNTDNEYRENRTIRVIDAY